MGFSFFLIYWKCHRKVIGLRIELMDTIKVNTSVLTPSYKARTVDRGAPLASDDVFFVLYEELLH